MFIWFCVVPSVVEGVMVVRTSGQEMTVSWTPLSLVEARGIIGNYTVSITIGGGGEVKRQNGGCTPDSSPCTVDSDQSSVIVTGLDPRQSYNVSVAAGTGAGEGEQSETQTALGEWIHNMDMVYLPNFCIARDKAKP